MSQQSLTVVSDSQESSNHRPSLIPSAYHASPSRGSTASPHKPSLNTSFTPIKRSPQRYTSAQYDLTDPLGLMQQNPHSVPIKENEAGPSSQSVDPGTAKAAQTPQLGLEAPMKQTGNDSDRKLSDPEADIDGTDDDSSSQDARGCPQPTVNHASKEEDEHDEQSMNPSGPAYLTSPTMSVRDAVITLHHDLFGGDDPHPQPPTPSARSVDTYYSIPTSPGTESLSFSAEMPPSRQQSSLPPRKGSPGGTTDLQFYTPQRPRAIPPQQPQSTTLNLPTPLRRDAPRVVKTPQPPSLITRPSAPTGPSTTGAAPLHGIRRERPETTTTRHSVSQTTKPRRSGISMPLGSEKPQRSSIDGPPTPLKQRQIPQTTAGGHGPRPAAASATSTASSTTTRQVRPERVPSTLQARTKMRTSIEPAIVLPTRPLARSSQLVTRQQGTQQPGTAPLAQQSGTAPQSRLSAANPHNSSAGTQERPATRRSLAAPPRSRTARARSRSPIVKQPTSSSPPALPSPRVIQIYNRVAASKTKISEDDAKPAPNNGSRQSGTSHGSGAIPDPHNRKLHTARLAARGLSDSSPHLARALSSSSVSSTQSSSTDTNTSSFPVPLTPRSSRRSAASRSSVIAPEQPRTTSLRGDRATGQLSTTSRKPLYRQVIPPSGHAAGMRSAQSKP